LPSILRVPERILIPIIGVLCATGAFAINNTAFDVGLIAVLGMIGFLLVRFGFAMAPLVLGLVLGPIIEINLRDALSANDMDLTVFATRPISAVFLIAIFMTIVLSIWKKQRS
jgi:putative tricarboxylic transport membrane protein